MYYDLWVALVCARLSSLAVPCGVLPCPPRSHAAFGQKPTSKWDDRLVQLWEDVEETLRHLRRMGFVAYQVLFGPLLK